MEKDKKKIYIRTFGCQMNDYDSEILQGILRKRGFELVDELDKCSIALFNTCSVREHAEERVYGKIGMLKKAKNNGLSVIGIIGCMAQAHREKILERLPHVDLICGPQSLYDIPDYIESVLSDKKLILSVDERLRPVDRENHHFREEIKGVKAHVTIMEGCNNFCSYCIVPYVRGREVSRPENLILKEIHHLCLKGVKEITLLGQNVNSYGRDLEYGYNFVNLLKDIDRVGEVRRLRFVTSHPKDADEQMFEAMAKLPSVCESLHLPLQSGSDKILTSMNRRYTAYDYLKKAALLRKHVPDSSLSTDIIVGYPGETDDDFNETKKMMQEIKFDTAYIFKYSPRPGTRAAKFADNVPKEVKEERNQQLLALQKRIVAENNLRLTGRVLGVLVEKEAKEDGYLLGRTRTDRVITFKGGRDLIGKIVEIRVNDAGATYIKGEYKKI